MPADVHTLPLCDLVDHNECRDCWCGPRLLRTCQECVHGTGGLPCWSCGGERMVPADLEDLDAVLVVHVAADGRE